MAFITIACPASWYAVSFLSASEITLDFFAGPAITLVVASSISSILILVPLRLAVKSAASLTKFSISAGEKPGVLLARISIVTSSASGLFLVWTLKISSLALTSGIPITICLSNLPGRSNAGSSTSGLFVAAKIMMPEFPSKPSISTRS